VLRGRRVVVERVRRVVLASWSRHTGVVGPAGRLVVSGPYHDLRNAMISGLVFVLFAEALALRSRPRLA